MPAWRVLIVEDDVSTRDFFVDGVSRCAELRLVAAVGTCEEARLVMENATQVIDV